MNLILFCQQFWLRPQPFAECKPPSLVEEGRERGRPDCKVMPSIILDGDHLLPQDANLPIEALNGAELSTLKKRLHQWTIIVAVAPSIDGADCEASIQHSWDVEFLNPHVDLRVQRQKKSSICVVV